MSKEIKNVRCNFEKWIKMERSMMNVKKRMKFIMLNFIINYNLGFFSFFLIYNLFKSKLMHSNFYINMFLTPAIISFLSSFHIWFGTKYAVIKLKYNSESNLKKKLIFQIQIE